MCFHYLCVFCLLVCLFQWIFQKWMALLLWTLQTAALFWTGHEWQVSLVTSCPGGTSQVSDFTLRYSITFIIMQFPVEKKKKMYNSHAVLIVVLIEPCSNWHRFKKSVWIDRVMISNSMTLLEIICFRVLCGLKWKYHGTCYCSVYWVST